MDKPRVNGEPEALRKRGISEDVCKRFHFNVSIFPKDYPARDGTPLGKMKGKKVHIQNAYNEDRELVGQIIRDSEKNFAIIGDVNGCLIGRHAVKAGGKLLVITEGIYDAMAYAEVRQGWPAVSIPNGTQSAKKAIEANLEWIETFDKVVLAFDNDDKGEEAIEACKHMISPGKCYIHSLPAEYKDMSEALEDGDTKAILKAVFDAEEVRMDGIVGIDEILEEAMKPVEWGIPWFIPELTQLTYGRRWGEAYALGAGTGIGKTDFFMEQVAYDVNELGQKVGCLFLEQKPVETVKRVAGKIADKRFHVPDAGWTPDDLRTAALQLRGKVTFYDSFGHTDWAVVKNAIRQMHIAQGIRIFYVDHLTAMADTGDEKGSIEQIMKEMAGLANELSIIIHFISHLATPDGTPHEEGGRVAIRHFKGSRSIGFWSFLMLGLERNQQDEDETKRHLTVLRVLKDRYTGQATGHTLLLGYNAETGRMILPSALGFDELPDTTKEEEF